MTSDAPDAARSRPGPMPAPLRASDADRHETVRLLQDAVARGLLTHDEGGERMATAFAARYLHQLPPLTADLPAAPAPPLAPGWRQLASLAVLQARTDLSGLAADGLRSRRVLVAAAGLFIGLMLLVTLGVAGLHLLFGGPDHFGGFEARH